MENSLVVYKNKPAIVKEKADGKFSILLQDGTQIKVRDKDIELIHPGLVKDFKSIIDNELSVSAIREAWELLSEESTPMSLKDLSLFIFNQFTPASAYTVYSLLRDGLYFSGAISKIIPRSKAETTAEEAKRETLQRETGERTRFLEYLKTCLKNTGSSITVQISSEDARFMQDIEALAYGKSAKSRTMKDLGLGETPEDAHLLLLKSGFWTGMINPHPGRFGLSLSGADICPSAPPLEEKRQDLCHLPAFAIDSPWSNDPDDAISIETADSQMSSVLYVHIADPASSIVFDSPAEKEARDRGATLYLPEGAVRMLADDVLPLYALGLSEKSFALTFKMTIDESGAVTGTEIFPSIIKVRRITYENADMEMENGNDGAVLHSLYDLSQKINKRRAAQGAVNIELPDVHITVENECVKIEPVMEWRSALIVKECMIAANEGAGTWAAQRGLAFPYISQEAELPNDHMKLARAGMAGAIQLRKCMRPRILSVKPGRHQGLALDTYTQVTSPLRRYTDLLAHIQIRAFLRGEKPLGADDVSARLGFSEAAAAAVVQAERASENHWKMVYLSGKKDSLWDATVLENKGSRWAVMIPLLAMETQVALQRSVSPNDSIKLVLKSVNIAKGEAVFVSATRE